jgi:diguanylate cyclase (GGDEF)-like protein
LSDKLIHHFLQSLITLTKERDIVELESALKQTLSDLIKSVSQHEVESIKIYRLRDISQLFFSLLSGAANKMRDEVSAELCQQLMDCYNTGEYRTYLMPDSDGPYHLFPLKNDIAHQNSVLAIKSHINDIHIRDGIAKLLDVYQNYIGLLNDNERDTLTGLLNRKTFDLRINKILANMHQKHTRKNDRTVQAYFLAVFDIDHFKKVNDLHGHLIGDEVLLLFSQLMAKSFRETDPLFRFGGEEFVGIFGCASDEDIAHVLGRFTKKLQDYLFPQVGKVTASVGYTKLSVEHTPSQSVDRADLALYYAKNNGRNQICYYEELVSKGLLKEIVNEGEIELF